MDQAGWGSTKVYADGTLDGEYDPRLIIAHWGGLTRERQTDEQAFDTLRGWQRYHVGKGWQDIAYNFAVTEQGTICRLRGNNHGGHASGDDPVSGKAWSTAGIGIVWVGGQSDSDGPSDAAKAAMRTCVDSVGLPIIGHQDTGKATACPGPDWLTWVHDYTPTGEEMRISDIADETWAQWYRDGHIQGNPSVMPGYYYAGGNASDTERVNAYNVAMRSISNRGSVGSHTHPVVVNIPAVRVNTNTGDNT